MPDTEKKDWGNFRLRPRSQPPGQHEDDPGRRFATAIVVFLLVALAYPWYAYWVQSRLVARDLAQAANALGRQAQAAAGETQAMAQARSASGRSEKQQPRANRLRIVGATLGNGSPMVIVEMGGAGLAESSPEICRQAAEWLGRPLDGVALRVQRGQAGRGAIRVGTIGC
jgi:cbb3-type cytochrome oxidase subunit 3